MKNENKLMQYTVTAKNMEAVQFLRFIAAFIVVLFHARVTQLRFFPHLESKNIDYVMNFGASGVHIFFVISGFIMTYTSYQKFGKRGVSTEFLLRRFCRIYPIYWAYALTYLAVYAIFYGSYQLGPLQVASSLLLFPQNASSIIGPAWTLAYEVYFYICFGFALLMPRRYGLLSLTTFFVLSILVARVTSLSSSEIGIYANPLLLEFLMGCWIARVVSGNWCFPASAGWTCIISAAGLFLLVMGLGYQDLPTVIIWGVPSALLVLGATLVEKAGGLPKVVQRLSFLGDSSYSLYLIHLLVLQVLYSITSAVGITTGYSILDFVLISVACAVVGLVAFQLVELPLTKAAKRLLLFPYLKRHEQKSILNSELQP